MVVIERIKLFFYQQPELSSSSDSPSNLSNDPLVTHNLTKSYDSKVKAVDGVSFRVRQGGQIVGLLGANGAGKSSTFNMVTM